MDPGDIIQLLRRKPFEPFQVQVSDGTTYDVRHPELVLVTLGSLVIGVPGPKYGGMVAERLEMVSLLHVVKAVPLTASPPTTGNGQG